MEGLTGLAALGIDKEDIDVLIEELQAEEPESEKKKLM